MLMLRCALVIDSEGYVPEERPVTHYRPRSSGAVLVGFPQMVAEHPWEALPPEVADVLRPELPGARRRDRRRAEPRRARLRAPARGARSGRRCGPGSRRRSGGSRRFVADPEADPDAGREVYLNLGRGEMRAGPEPRRAAGGLPARGAGGLAAAGRRGRAGRPLAAHPVHARRGDLRLHRRAVRATRSRATRASRRRRPARSSAAASAWPRCWSRTRRPAPATVEAAASNAGLAAAAQRLACWWWSRTRAARARSGWRSGSARMRSSRTCLR